MSLNLTPHGHVLLGDYFRKMNPVFDDFIITHDSEGASSWVVYYSMNPHPIARFKGTYPAASKALKTALITYRLTK